MASEVRIADADAREPEHGEQTGDDRALTVAHGSYLLLSVLAAGEEYAALVEHREREQTKDDEVGPRLFEYVQHGTHTVYAYAINQLGQVPLDHAGSHHGDAN